MPRLLLVLASLGGAGAFGFAPSAGSLGRRPRALAPAMGPRDVFDQYAAKLSAAAAGGLQPRVVEASQQWSRMSAAISLSGGARHDFASQGGYPDRELIDAAAEAAQPALDELLEACARRAPALVATEEAVLPLARLAVWVPRGEWVRGLAEWDPRQRADAAASLRSLEAHLLEKWDVPPALHGASGHRGDARSASVPEAAHRAAYAFVAAHAAAGAGSASVKDALQAALGGAEAEAESDGADGAPAEGTGAVVVSKAVAKRFSAAAAAPGGPVHALRRAQVGAQGGEDWVGDALCASRLGDALLGSEGSEGGVSEGYGVGVVGWCVTHADALAEPSEVANAANFALEMRRLDGGYTLAGRTPATVRGAMEAYARTTVTFDADEVFQPNPQGLSGLFRQGATIPQGTVVEVPYDDAFNGGPAGGYALGAGSAEERGSRPCTVRVEEIGSLRRLIYEGKMLNNCLEGKYDSQLKYVQRARQRVSSFWSFTMTYEGEAPAYLCLAEVWHLRSGNIIRQAEGPRPRTLPGPEAWYWLDKWCAQEGVSLETWDVYSRVEAPIPPPPVL